MSDSSPELEIPERDVPSCPACGAVPNRATARYCATCGRRLDEDYFPTDSLLSSYYRRTRDRSTFTPTKTDARTVLARPIKTRARASKPTSIFKTDENNFARTAMAFATYALVPYLGILFCPGAVLMGGVGLLRANRSPEIGGSRRSATGVVMGLVLLAIQLFLWWILYKVPEWTQPGIGGPGPG